MLISKHFDPVIGIDIHILVIPPAGPVPIPHPHIALVFDPIDYVPILGATVKVGGLPRSTAGTAGKPIPHIPMGGPFAKPPMNENEIFMGSVTVLADGGPLSYTAVPSLSCHDIGMIAPPRKKKPKKSYGMVLPTSVVLSIPLGMPVMVGGAPTIDMMGLAMAGGFAALGGAFKKLRKMQKKSKRMKKMSDAIHKRAKKAMDKLGVPPNVRNKVHKSICTVTGHPVDVASGKVFTDHIDFELPGPIPLVWERTWYSTSVYQGPLGHGWHHSYDLALQEEDGAVALRLADGRAVAFPALENHEICFQRTERLTLSRNEYGYQVNDHKGMMYQFSPCNNNSNRQYLWFIREQGSQAQINFYYDHNDYLIGIIDSAGRKIRIQNFDDGTIHKIHLPHPESISEKEYFCAVEYCYGEGDMIGARDALHHHTRYRYNNHLLIKETNRNDFSFYFEYAGNNQDAHCVRTWGDGGVYDHKLHYDLAKHITVVENSLGYKSIYYHDGSLVYQAITPGGAITTTKRNTFNEAIEILDPMGNKTSYEYDAAGYTKRIVNPDGSTKEFLYDQHNNLVQYKNEIDAQWQFEYNQDNRLITMTDPLGVAVSYKYENNLLCSITTDDIHKQVLFYDRHKNLRTIVTNDEISISYRYDAMGNTIEIIDEANNKTSLKYDLAGRVIHIKQKGTTLRSFAYDPEGNLQLLKEDDLVIQYSYIGFNRIQTKTENGETIHYRYNTEELLTNIINADNEEYTFYYDSSLNLSAERGFDGLMKRYFRDNNGKIITIRRDDERYTNYIRDKSGNIIKTEHSDGLVEEYTYRFDGQMTSAKNNHFSIKFEIDKLGNITKEIQDGVEILSEYDKLGNRKLVGSSLGALQLIKRDTRGFISELIHGNQSQKISIAKNNKGDEMCRLLPGGVSQKWKRDSFGRPSEETVEIDHHIVHQTQYFWKNLTDIAKITADGTAAVNYTHDKFGNPVTAQNNYGDFDSRYIGNSGNIYKHVSETDRSYASGGRIQRIENKNCPITWAYDSDGNIVSKIDGNGVYKYEWNHAGFLTKVIRPDQQVVEFEYDALGRRKTKIFNGKATRWIWDGECILHEWIEDISTTKKSFPPTKSFVVDKKVVDSDDFTTWYFEPESYSPICKQVNDEYFSLLTDHLGTSVWMYDTQGTEVWSGQFNLSGEIIKHIGNKTACPFRWPGQYEDIETGLYYNRFRYYSPETGQYISQDPLGLFAGKINLYSYVNNVLLEFDPLGLVDGGSHRSVRRTNTGGQVNHMPANSISPHSHGKGPSTWMSTADHQKTSSWGSWAYAERWRAQQKELIQRGKFGKAMEMDIRDVQRHCGNKYNQGIREMLDYAADQGYVTRKEANRLKRRYCH